MLSLAEKITGYLLRFGQNQFVVFIIEQQQLFFPYLINLSRDNLAHLFFVLVVQVVLLQLQNLGCQGLAQVKNGAASEMLKRHLVGHLFTHFKVLVNFQSFRQGDFQVGIFELIIFHDGSVAPDLQVSLVGVDDDVVILVCTDCL
ncbi:hypothetical protein SDC9_153934 [bioreactor metagenome]|uniref:Uncharacterized protein n=1 Tax=bioreactor metagenome TaxID=1076179 RepID=A0A645EXA7_9ZZZZ